MYIQNNLIYKNVVYCYSVSEVNNIINILRITARLFFSKRRNISIKWTNIKNIQELIKKLTNILLLFFGGMP